MLKSVNGEQAPEKKLTRVIEETVGNASIIAEDLGVIIPPVRELIEKNGLAGNENI